MSKPNEWYEIEFEYLERERDKYRMALEKIKYEYRECDMYCNIRECSNICTTYRIKQIINEVLK